MINYLIIGNGVAGTTAAGEIRHLDKEGKITIITEEDLPFYYRIRLNEYLAGGIDEKSLIAKKEQWYNEQGIELILNTRVISGNSQKKSIITENGSTFTYDRLLIATGSHSFVPPIKGSDKIGVFTLRSITDARNILSFVRNVQNVVLIGGGLLGLEAGNALKKLGKKVIIIEFFSRLLPRQLDPDGAKMLQNKLEEMGFSFRLGAKTSEIIGADRVTDVVLEGGEVLPAGLVIISAGVRPNLELAEPLNLEHDKGISVNERLETNQANIFAAGDVAEFRGMQYGIWPAAMEQGSIAGINMSGGDTSYQGTTIANTLKVAGIQLASAGDIDPEGKFESKVFTDQNIYKKLVIKNNRIIGCIMLGNTTGFNKIKEIMSDKRDISQVKDIILLEDFDFKNL